MLARPKVKTSAKFVQTSAEVCKKGMRKGLFKCAHSPKYQRRRHDFYISLRLIVLLLHERTNTKTLTYTN